MTCRLSVQFEAFRIGFVRDLHLDVGQILRLAVAILAALAAGEELLQRMPRMVFRLAFFIWYALLIFYLLM